MISFSDDSTQRELSSEDPSYPPPRRRGFRLLPLVLFAAFALFYYFSNREEVPLTGRKHIVGMDTQSELALGLQSYQQVLMQSEVLASGADFEQVRTVGARLAAVAENDQFEWEFALLRSPQVNAFCLPGGKVAVYSGIMPVALNQDGLAVVMGHEIAHAIARHGAERMAHEQLARFGQFALGMSMSEMEPERQRAVMGAFGLGTQFGVLLPFSRKHESEADYMGLIYMARACFDPREAPSFWERMTSSSESGQPPQFLSTHPSHETRIQQLEEWLPKALAEYSAHCA